MSKNAEREKVTNSFLWFHRVIRDLCWIEF